MFINSNRVRVFQLRLLTWSGVHALLTLRRTTMTFGLQPAHIPRALIAAAPFSLLAGAVAAKDVKVGLTGAEETPPVTSSATAEGKISIAKDHTVKGEIKTTGINGV